MNLLELAVTQWINTTYEGTVAYEHSSAGFDIGDLVHHCTGDVLKFWGITDLKVKILPAWEHQDYDHHLYVGDNL